MSVLVHYVRSHWSRQYEMGLNDGEGRLLANGLVVFDLGEWESVEQFVEGVGIGLYAITPVRDDGLDYGEVYTIEIGGPGTSRLEELPAARA